MIELYTKTKVLLGVAVALAGATVGTSVYYFQTTAEEIKVPDFSGETKEDVETWRQDSKLAEDRISYSYSFDEELAEDAVISQSMEAGMVLSAQEVLGIVLSSGPDPDKEFSLPDFTGQSRTEVVKWFTDNRFANVSYVFQEQEGVEEDTFLEASVEAGTTVKRSQELTVTFAIGNSDQEVTVPDFSSYSRANIQAWASTNGITVSFVTKASDTVAAGKVIAQSVAAGTIIKTGSSLTVTLSGGKAVTVVSYVGSTREEAEAWASKNGLKAVYVSYYSSEAENTILSQSPASGTVSAGSSVTFGVSAGLVPLTDYTGRTRTEFASYISSLNKENNASAKLTVTYTEKQTSDAAAGTILSQSASGKVKPGTAVTVEVAAGVKVTVTSKAGSTLDAFKSYLSSLNLRLGTATYSYSDTVAEGSLISNQTGTFEAGASIDCVVSKGSYTWDASSYISPGSSWSTLYSASYEARRNGYSVTKTDVESSEYDAGSIVSCTVSSKSIACQVSIGRYVTVPDAVGKTQAEGEAAMTAAGLKVSSVTSSTYSSEYAAGTVMGQSTAAGTSVKQGSSVTLTISKGPEPVATGIVPIYRLSVYDGYSADQIRSDLTSLFNEAGFTNLEFVKIDTSTNTGGDRTNRKGVQSISAASGSELPLTTLITITYYSPE